MIPPVNIQHAPLDANALREAALSPESGAVVLFEGIARNHGNGKPVLGLAFDAYEPMALARLEELRREALEKFALRACFIHHRLGAVALGEAAVVVVCASPHRAEAFAAAAWLLDRLKESVPIWKRELYADGGECWVEGARAVGPVE